MNVRCVLLLAAFVSVAPSALRAAETAADWIAKARAFLGAESALNAVTSIHYYGLLETTDDARAPEGSTTPTGSVGSVSAEIVVQKPFQQRIILTKPDATETKVLDGYDGWAKSTSVKNPKQWRFRLLEAQEIRQLRANTWENLNFFSGLEKKGGSVQLGGDVTVEGVACVKLSFLHADNIIFIRYFERSTGRLIKTETENGGEIHEEGEVIVAGIRFPRKVVNKAANGQVTSLAIDRVVLNELIPAGEFAVPLLSID